MKKVEYKSPEELKELTDKKRPETDAFIKKLKKKKPRNLDAIVHELHDEAFAEFDCLDCANCCKTTSPLFTDRDVNRISKFLKLKSRQFIDQYLKTDEDGDLVLQSSPCPFLFEDNKCMIYEVRPKACAEYPHTNRKKFHQISNITLKNTSICPAAFDIVEKLKVKLKT